VQVIASHLQTFTVQSAPNDTIIAAGQPLLLSRPYFE
jgi:hypothetical protein